MNMNMGSKAMFRSVTVCAMACTVIVTGCVPDANVQKSEGPNATTDRELTEFDRVLGVDLQRTEPTPPGKREDFVKATFTFHDWKTMAVKKSEVKSAEEAYRILDVLRSGYLSKYPLPGGRSLPPLYFSIEFRKGAPIKEEIGLIDDETRWNKEARDLFKKYFEKSKVVGKFKQRDG